MLAKKPIVTFGADPEFFVRERSTGTTIPSCGLFGGEKGNPTILSNKGGYLEDGVTIEFNVAPSASLTQVRADLRELIGLWHQRFPQHELVGEPACQFDAAELKKHRTAMEIGCSADLSAWGVRRTPQVSDFGEVRFAGGHIHIGMDPWPEEYSKEFLIRWLDLFAYVPSLKFVKPDRFPYYGKPGLYRSTSYGVEYRTPDNTWVLNDKAFEIPKQVELMVGALLESHRDPLDIQQRFAGMLHSETAAEYLREPADPHECSPEAYPPRWRNMRQNLAYCVAY